MFVRFFQLTLLVVLVVLALLLVTAPAWSAKAANGREPGDPRVPTFSGFYTGRTAGPWIGGNSWPHSGPGISIVPPVMVNPMAAFTDWKGLHLARLGTVAETALENIQFGFDKTVIEQKFESDLDFVSRLLIENPEVSLTLSGHTDAVGSVEYNDALADRRAAAVLDALVERGVPTERLTAVGFGESNPLDLVTTALRANRRVEVEVTIEVPVYLD